MNIKKFFFTAFVIVVALRLTEMRLQLLIALAGIKPALAFP